MIGNRVTILLGLVMAGMMLWFMTGLLAVMDAMTATVSRLGEDIRTASLTMEAMRQDTARMVDHIAAMQQNITNFDRNMNRVHHNIAGIQHTMSEDLEQMRTLLDSMSRDMGGMNTTTQRMSAYIGRMTYDMDHLANTVSPLDGYWGFP